MPAPIDDHSLPAATPPAMSFLHAFLHAHASSARVPSFVLVLAALATPAFASAQDHAHGHAGAMQPVPADAAKDEDPAMDDAAHAHAMPMASSTGALGPYPMTREASGTSWQPDASTHQGVHTAHEPWESMSHAVFNAVYDTQGGRRGDDKSFLSGMVMTQARRPLGTGNVLQLRAMASPDPLMGRSGYPLLLASGETADGVHPLVDRQHPHELVMELSASVRHTVSDTGAVFGYVGLPGEPAFGPPAFMHRRSIMDSPEAPITHHWLDSTHIAFGVVTVGYVHDRWKLEASRFNGREPDEHRYDIETGPLDSTALRASWNPSARWSLQASWARLISPEQLAPGENQTKWSASALYARPLDAERALSVTAAWGRRIGDHGGLDAWALEASLQPARAWTVFARAERTENNELSATTGHGDAHTVAKISAGALRDFTVARHATIGIGALLSVNFLDGVLEPLYGSRPAGGMVFVRLKVD